MLSAMEDEAKPIILEPAFVRAKALVRLEVANSIAEGTLSGDVSFETLAAVQNLRYSLRLNPADSFLWLMLYWIEVGRVGLDSRNVRFLEASYGLGPREGWIALRRNSLALAAFQSLSSGTRTQALGEFGDMVDAGFVDQSSATLLHVGSDLRSKLVDATKSADIGARRALAQRLSIEGLKISLPGVSSEDERPWR